MAHAPENDDNAVLQQACPICLNSLSPWFEKKLPAVQMTTKLTRKNRLGIISPEFWRRSVGQGVCTSLVLRRTKTE